MAFIGVNIHVYDDAFVFERKHPAIDKPFYVLRIGEARLFLEPARVADLLAAIQPLAEAAAADCRPRAEALPGEVA